MKELFPKQQGFTLIELLMVLVGIAVILLLSIHRYRDYQRRIQLAGVRNDIATIQQAANRYYHIEGCTRNGRFAGNPSPSMMDLGLSLKARPPIIPMVANAYSVNIVETKEQTTQNKPVYALQVRAELNSHYSSKRMLWYQKVLDAGSVKAHTLTWMTLPNNTASDPGTTLWVMKAEGEQFRQRENQKRQNLSQYVVSGSYCAH